MNKNLLYKDLTIPPEPIEDDYHISADITVGQYIGTNERHYGYNNYAGKLFGECYNNKIAQLTGADTTLNGVRTIQTVLNLINNNKYENMTARVSRLDSKITITLRCNYLQDKDIYSWDDGGSEIMIFNSSDVGKTISVYIEIS